MKPPLHVYAFDYFKVLEIWFLISLGDDTAMWGSEWVSESCSVMSESFVTPWIVQLHEIFQARILEWVAFSFSRGSSQPRDWTPVSHIEGRFFTSWSTREAQECWSG